MFVLIKKIWMQKFSLLQKVIKTTTKAIKSNRVYRMQSNTTCDKFSLHKGDNVKWLQFLFKLF